MLLTLKPSSPPSQNGIKPPGPQEYSVVRQFIPSLRDSTAPPFRPPSGPPSPTLTTTAAGNHTSASAMDSIASSRRNLPPPSSRTLPPPPSLTAQQQQQQSQQLPPPPHSQHPPPQWQNLDKDVSMHLWLQAKAEEDRKRQEEEKARQETLRLEQRVIEHSMLRDALQAGVPPHMVPLIFAGISNGGLPQSILDLTQQYMTQLGQQPVSGPAPPSMPPPPSHQHQLGHQRHPSTSGLEISASALPAPPAPPRYSQPGVPSELRRDSHSLPSNTVYPTQPPVPPPGDTLPSQPLSMPGGSSNSSPVRQPLAHSAFPGGGLSPASSVPRLSEGPGHYPPGGNQQYAPGSAAAPPQSTFGKEYQYRPRQSSTSIYFHHWVPPGQSHASTSGGKASQESSMPSHSHSHSRSEYQSSPGRKRKSQGPHQPAPVPSSRSRQSSPAASGRRPGRPSHRRQQSDISMTHQSRALGYIEPEHNNLGSKLTAPVLGEMASEKGHARGNSSSQGKADSVEPESAGGGWGGGDYSNSKRDEQPENPHPHPYDSDRATSRTPPKTATSGTDDDEPGRPGERS